jgi:hypothetical protein
MLTSFGEQIDPALVSRGTAFTVKDLRGKKLPEHCGKPRRQLNPGLGGVDRCSDWFGSRHPAARLYSAGATDAEIRP